MYTKSGYWAMSCAGENLTKDFSGRYVIYFSELFLTMKNWHFIFPKILGEFEVLSGSIQEAKYLVKLLILFYFILDYFRSSSTETWLHR